MKTLKELKIDSDIMNVAHRLEYEYNGLVNLLNSMITATKEVGTYNEELFNLFLNRYNEKFIERQVFFNEIVDTFGPEFKGRDDVKVYYNFITNEIKFTLEEESKPMIKGCVKKCQE